MRLCLVSDSHRHRHELLTAVKSVQPIDAILHAGDELSDAEWLSDRVDWPIFAVAGNWDAPRANFPMERIIRDFGPTILLTHGHQYRVKDGLSTLADKARAVGSQIVVYGHTHIAVATVQDGRLFVNPGSLASPRGRRERTFAILEIEQPLTTGGYGVRVTHVTASGDRTQANLRVDLPEAGHSSG